MPTRNGVEGVYLIGFIRLTKHPRGERGLRTGKIFFLQRITEHQQNTKKQARIPRTQLLSAIPPPMLLLALFLDISFFDFLPSLYAQILQTEIVGGGKSGKKGLEETYIRALKRNTT